MNNIIGIMASKVSAAKFFLVLMDYDLIVIEDEEVPMAASASHVNYYVVILAVIAGIALISLLAWWLTRRKKYVKRLVELSVQTNTPVKVPLFIKSIREKIEYLESEISASMI